MTQLSRPLSEVDASQMDSGVPITCAWRTGFRAGRGIPFCFGLFLSRSVIMDSLVMCTLRIPQLHVGSAPGGFENLLKDVLSLLGSYRSTVAKACEADANGMGFPNATDAGTPDTCFLWHETKTGTWKLY